MQTEYTPVPTSTRSSSEDPDLVSYPSDFYTRMIMFLSLRHYTPEAAERVKRLIDIQTVRPL